MIRQLHANQATCSKFDQPAKTMNQPVTLFIYNLFELFMHKYLIVDMTAL